MTTHGNQWDGYVRISTSALPGIRLRHLVSEKDPTISVGGDDKGTITLTGHTEWTGEWRGQTLSIGWDWGVLRGSIMLVNPKEIRTNILLIGPDGRPERPQAARVHFLQWLEQVPWRRVGVEELLKKG